MGFDRDPRPPLAPICHSSITTIVVNEIPDPKNYLLVLGCKLNYNSNLRVMNPRGHTNPPPPI